MKILHLAHQYPPEFTGGTEFYTQQLCQQLRLLGHETAVFYRRPGQGLAERVDPDGTRVWGAGAGPMTPLRRFRATFGQKSLLADWQGALAAYQPDLIHVQHLMGLPAELLAASSVPYLITFHDYWWVCANAQLLTNYDQTICAGPDHFINCGRCALARGGAGALQLGAPLMAPLLARRNQTLATILQNAAARIAPTEFVRGRYQALGVTAPIELIRHGIDYPRDLPAARRQPGPLQLVYLGSIAPQKGLHVAIAAVNELPPDAVRFTLYGGLTDFPDYVAELRRLARHPGIEFAGRLTREQVWERLPQADAALLPTQWFEASPLTIDEMFVAGLPVIGSHIGALPDKIVPEVDGLLVAPADVAAWVAALRRLLDEPELLPRLRAGIRPVRHIDDHVQEIVALYEKVLAGGQ
ncbi:MAG: glycosyltransferase [Anaerolineales bacterium]|nr:glycosyltransferase [Anaerolineales bacterium]